MYIGYISFHCIHNSKTVAWPFVSTLWSLFA